MAASVRALADAIQHYPKLFVLTGAGISAPSGIPTYRDHNGTWLHRQPIQHKEFLEQPLQRQRYWARSMLGWEAMANAAPNEAHLALVQLQRGGFVEQLVTQNVDNLHQQAGHQDVLDLHGNLSRVVCLACGATEYRAEVQKRLVASNPLLEEFIHKLSRKLVQRPDGDADIDDFPMQEVKAPECQLCQGTLMPDVVFFGGTVPPDKVRRAIASLNNANAVLIVGSSLQVYSGYRFCRLAAENNKPILMINQGLSRADSLLSVKVEQDCSSVLMRLLDYIKPCQ